MLIRKLFFGVIPTTKCIIVLLLLLQQQKNRKIKNDSRQRLIS